MRTHILVITAIFLLLGLQACDDQVVFEKNVPIPDGIWDRANPVAIEFVISDTLQPTNLIFNLRHSTSYNFSNLYIFIETRYPDERSIRDTLEFLLAGHDGRWYGKGFGKIKDLQIPIRRALTFPMQGNYAFIIEQAMRVNDLNGIEDVGIRIEKSRN